MDNEDSKPTQMEERLKYVVGLVNDWLRYAETKNAGLLVASGTLLKLATDHFPPRTDGPVIFYGALLGCGCMVLSVIVCLLSFLPALKFEWLVSKRARSAKHNLFYFRHIAMFSAFDYLTALYQAEGLTDAKRKVEIDLAGQIVINSKIATRKFLEFSAALWISVVGILCLSAVWTLKMMVAT